MISTIQPAAVLTPPAPATLDPATSPLTARTQGLQSLGSPPSPPPADLPKLTDHDETLLETILIPGHSLFSAAKEHKISLQQLLDWWSQPHIKAALAAITDLGQARALALAARHSASAVCWLQSAGTLTDCEFYENADPKTRLRAFESARKSANSLLKLAGLPVPRAITRGSARVMPPGDRSATSGGRSPTPSESAPKEGAFPSDPTLSRHPVGPAPHHARNGTHDRKSSHVSNRAGPRRPEPSHPPA